VRILFISYYLPPLLYPQSIQVGRFLQFLKQYQDLEITVVTAEETSHIDNKLYPDIYETMTVVKIENTFNMYMNYIKNRYLSFIYQRPDSFLPWMHKVVSYITNTYKKDEFDVILTFSYPLSTNLLGKKLKEYFNCKWVAHNSDPWVDNPHAHFKKYMKALNQKLEKQCFEYADRLIFTSLETSNFYKNKYPFMKEKINTINHSYDDNLYTDHNCEHEKLVIRYIGSFYGTRTPKPLFEAVKLLDEKVRDRFIIELIGGGKKAKALLTEYNFNNITVTNSVSYLESLHLMKSANLLLVIDAPSDEVSIFFPSKLADYIGANKPILGISPPGTSNRILKELGFECYNPLEIEKIANALRIFVEQGASNTHFKDNNSYAITNNIKSLKAILDT
jgi:glycosyltransferase involved in cell wall biosynthesis